jgi:hypothetical protein
MNLLENRYKRSENLVFRKITDQTILVPIKGNVGDLSYIYQLDDVASFIWERIDGRRELGDIKKMVMNEYDVSGEKAEKDLLDFVGQLEEIGGIFREDVNNT